jgi:hypothetical protein
LGELPKTGLQVIEIQGVIFWVEEFWAQRPESPSFSMAHDSAPAAFPACPRIMQPPKTKRVDPPRIYFVFVNWQKNGRPFRGGLGQKSFSQDLRPALAGYSAMVIAIPMPG